MSAGAIVGIIVAVVVVVLVIGLMSAARRRKLQQRFGPEYDRVVGETHSHRKANSELAERERRVRSLDIHPLDETVRAKYAGEWAAIQERFVDQPEQAVAQAGHARHIRDEGPWLPDRGLRPDPRGPVGGAREHAGSLPRGESGQPASPGGHRLHRGPAPRDAALPGAVRRPARPAGGSRHRARRPGQQVKAAAAAARPAEMLPAEPVPDEGLPTDARPAGAGAPGAADADSEPVVPAPRTGPAR